MNIKQALEEARNILKSNNFEDSNIIAKELLSYVLKKDKVYLTINSDTALTDTEYAEFTKYIEQIIDGKPLQYITQKQEFMGIDFFVNEDVLIPQPDTEILVETVLDICKKYDKQSLRILDLCTGSGAIAISLSKILNTQVFASDVSIKALKVAEKNNVLNNSKVEFIESNLFEQINGEKFDIIVSNPPYIKNEEIKLLSKQVQNEPYIALSGGEDGLDFYRKIIDEAYKHINKNGYLCLEIGYDQKEDLIKLIKQNENYEYENCIKDLSNNDRCIIAKIV
ncbi:MAG: peptide chain release factor N(5)-glutamine methyltransferase [Clostridium sp.]|nr:peptide chain release factor N(5)-glutamine methyltransferase [Clostridium sp.]